MAYPHQHHQNGPASSNYPNSLQQHHQASHPLQHHQQQHQHHPHHQYHHHQHRGGPHQQHQQHQQQQQPLLDNNEEYGMMSSYNNGSSANTSVADVSSSCLMPLLGQQQTNTTRDNADHGGVGSRSCSVSALDLTFPLQQSSQRHSHHQSWDYQNNNNKHRISYPWSQHSGYFPLTRYGNYVLPVVIIVIIYKNYFYYQVW